MYTTYRLTGEAKRWWQAKKDMLMLDGIGTSYYMGDLQGRIPQAIISASSAEGQGKGLHGSSPRGYDVIEYASTFIQLSRFSV